MKFFKFSVTPYWLSIIPFLWDGHISMLLNYYFSPELFLIVPPLYYLSIHLNSPAVLIIVHFYTLFV